MSVAETILAAMRQTNAVFEDEVVRNKDFSALNRVYTVRARILPPGAPMVTGREQIVAFWREAISGLGVKGATLATVDAELAGDSIVEVGRADLTVADGQTVQVKYVVQWKQEDGLWKWNIDIWNLNH